MTPVHAAVLFADSFDRPDNRNIDASLAGITDNTGSSFAADGVYSQPWLDPENGPPNYGSQDSSAGNGGGAQILANTLQLAVGVGTSNAYINHNFTNASIISTGGFSVTIDVTGYNQSTSGQGGGFAIGMSAAEAASAGDAWNGATKMTEAFGEPDGTFVSVADFWVALRGDATVQWGGIGDDNVFGTASVAAKTGTLSATFTGFTDFDAGTSVDYEVFYDGTAVGTGSFLWSGTNENFIGLDARDNTAVSLDNLSIETIPEPAVATLGAAGLLCLLLRRR